MTNNQLEQIKEIVELEEYKNAVGVTCYRAVVAGLQITKIEKILGYMDFFPIIHTEYYHDEKTIMIINSNTII